MALAYVPITLTNNESTATGSGFQQLLLNIDMRSYEPFLNDDLSNVYFSSDSAGSTVINSWLESGNSSTSAATTWWVVTSVAANSTTTIYMQVDLTGTSHRNNTTTGEAPQLSSTYAEYDNGASVFSNYWNFAGTVLPSGWTNTGITYSVNNGIVATATTASGYISYGTSVSSPIIIEGYGNIYEPNDNWVGLGVITVPVVNQAGYQGMSISTGFSGSNFPAVGIYQGTQTEGSTYTTTGGAVTPNSNQIWSVAYISTSSSAYYSNYVQQGTTITTPTVSTPLYPAIFEAGSGAVAYTFSQSASLSWLRIRAYPPSGIMPTVGLGQPTNFPYINTSTNPVEVPDL